MSSAVLNLTGQVTVGGGVCSPCDGGGTNQKVVGIGFACGANASFGCIVSTDKFCQLTSPNDFVDIGVLADLTTIQFILLQTNGGPLKVRVGAAVASVPTAGTFPTGFVGAETLLATIDGLATITTTFLVGDQAAADVANRINAAFSLGGQAPPASVNATTGQVDIKSTKTGADGSVVINSGTGLVALGLVAGTTTGAGADIDVEGIWLQQFPTTLAPARIQFKGTAQYNILAAGTV